MYREERLSERVAEEDVGRKFTEEEEGGEGGTEGRAREESWIEVLRCPEELPL